MNIKQKTESVLSKSFLNVILLSLGTIGSQLIGFLVLPLLSRKYDPTAFGSFYEFTGMIQLMVIFSTLKYDKSIILPKKLNESKVQLAISIVLISLFTFIITIFLITAYFFNYSILNIHVNYFLIPITIFVYSIVNILNQWFQKLERFNYISIIGICNTISVFAFSYFISGKNGLVYGYILGYGAMFVLLFMFNFEKTINYIINIPFSKLLPGLKKYINFPKYFLLYDLSTSGFVYLLPIILTNFYSHTECGFFSMAYRILMIPIIVISVSVSSVFLVNAQKERISKNNFENIYKKTFLKLFILGITIFTFIFIWGDFIIVKILGEKWSGIGLYIRIICPFLLFEFITYVFRSNTYIIVEKQKLGLIVQLLYFFISIFILVYYSSYGLMITLKFFGFISIMFSIVNLIITYNLSRNKKYITY